MAHLIVGLHTAIQHDLETSMSLLRDGISRYNLAVGTANTDTGGYHETITLFFAHAMQAFKATFADATPFDVMVGRLESSVLVDPGFMLSFFSKDQLFTVEARRRQIEPDLRPLSELEALDFEIHP